MLERHHLADSSLPSPLSVPVAGGGILRRVLDWSLVAGAFGLILFSTVALRPPAPVAGEAARTTSMVAVAR